MKLKGFMLDSATGVYVGSITASHINYLDGSEKYLRDALLLTHDLSLLSEELKSSIRDWPSLYHLSPYRATILDCFDFQNTDATVLELGAGCGAVTRWLGEHFQDVHTVEGNLQRAHIARLRCKDLPSVKLYAANFYDIDVEGQFDVVTLIGVLEYSHLYHPAHKGNPHKAASATLEFALRALKDNGILLLAIENKLGLKYFSGAKEDHSGKLFDGIQGYPDGKTPVTFSAAELEYLLRGAGFNTIDFYLPFPDYKLAKTIINAQALHSHHHHLYNWIETPFPDRVSQQRMLFFNESLVLREISKAGLLKDLSNSFLIIAHKGEKDINGKYFGFANDDWIVRNYSLSRHYSFCKRVSLVQRDSASLGVDSAHAFDTISRGNVDDSLFAHILTSEKYRPGTLLLFSVFEMIASGAFETLFLPLLKTLNEFLLYHFATGQKDEIGVDLLSGESLDVSLWNIIVDEKTGEWGIVDQEWISHSFIPADFIIWRNLYHFFVRYRAYFGPQYARKPTDELIHQILQGIYPSFSQERLRSAKQFDQSFQDFVNFGITKDKPFLPAQKPYRQPKSSGHGSRSD